MDTAALVLLIGLGSLMIALIFVSFLTRRDRDGPKRRIRTDILADELERHKDDNRDLKARLDRINRLNNLFFASMIRLTERINPEQIAGATVDLLADQLETDRLAVFLYDEKNQRLSVESQRGFDPKSMGKVVYKLDEGKVGFTAKRRYPTGNWESDPEVFEVKAEPYEMFRPDICYPMICEDKLYGVIAICRDGHFEEREKNLLGIVSAMAAVALNKARSFESKAREASLDPLTKLANIRHFKEKLHEQLDEMRSARERLDVRMRSQARGEGDESERERDKEHSIAITILDLDKFKEYNDTLGHQAGDELLIKLARIFRDHFDEKDEIARYGGDEFIIMSPGIAKQNKAHVVRNLLRNLEMYDFGLGPARGRVTFSAGVAGYPEDGNTVQDLIAAADSALYEAKHAGRNTVRVHHPKAKKV